MIVPLPFPLEPVVMSIQLVGLVTVQSQPTGALTTSDAAPPAALRVWAAGLIVRLREVMRKFVAELTALVPVMTRTGPDVVDAGTCATIRDVETTV